MKILIFSTLIIFSSVSLNAQDTLQLINGKSKIVKVNFETSTHVVYQKIKKGDTTKLGRKKNIEKEDIFRINYFFNAALDSVPKISQIYQVDSSMGDYFTVKEMEMFLLGKSQAHKNYKALKYALVGFCVGAGAGYLGPFWGAIPVGGYTAIAGSWTISPFFKADQPQWFNDLHFSAGYKETARIKQAKYAIIGGTVGLVSSVLFFNHYFNSKEEPTTEQQ